MLRTDVQHDADCAGSGAAWYRWRWLSSAAGFIRASSTSRRMFSDISSRVQENLAGVRVVRAYAQEKAEVAQFERLNREYIRENIGLARRSRACSCRCCRRLIGITFLLVLWAGGGRLLRARDQPGQLRDVQHLYGHADLADDCVRLGGEPDAARHGFAESHQRDDAPAIDRRGA